jgi:hypothetical protein
LKKDVCSREIGESKVHELAVMYRGQELLLTAVADELDKIYQKEEIRQYLIETVQTGKTRKQRAREESDERDRRWREFVQRKFRSSMHLSPAQNLLAELSVDYPRVAEAIEAEKLGQWMDDWYPYTPKVKDILERLSEFGLPAELALPEKPAPKVETPEETRERKAREKFGKGYDSLPREEKLWVLYSIVDPVKAEKVSPKAIQKWMVGKGSQPLTGQDVKNKFG